MYKLQYSQLKFNYSCRYESTFFNEQDKSNKSLHSDVPYLMTDSSFNKYMKQNATEFNKEYARYEENSLKISNKTDEIKKEVNNQSGQTVYKDCVPEIKTASKVIREIKNTQVLKHQCLKNNNIRTISNNIMKFIHGYCFSILKKGICYKQLHCRYKDNVSIFIYYFFFYIAYNHMYTNLISSLVAGSH